MWIVYAKPRYNIHNIFVAVFACGIAASAYADYCNRYGSFEHDYLCWEDLNK